MPLLIHFVAVLDWLLAVERSPAFLAASAMVVEDFVCLLTHVVACDEVVRLPEFDILLEVP